MRENKQSRSLRGSPLYMAPEILKCKVYDSKVDLWSVGVILYEVIFGYAPFSSSTLEVSSFTALWLHEKENDFSFFKELEKNININIRMIMVQSMNNIILQAMIKNSINISSRMVVVVQVGANMLIIVITTYQ